MTLRPVRLNPIFDLRPWGTRSLAPLFPQKSNLREHIGEAWLTGTECRFSDGPYADRKLGEVWPEMAADWRGTDLKRTQAFPLLVKFLFTEDKPSVQVHPSDDYASRFEQGHGGRGKTEMWYAVSARPDAEVLVGLKREVTPESFRQAIVNGTAENCLESIAVRPGDAIFVPAGTAHTIGAGLILCEIQEYSDITYRVYDYNRRDTAGELRPLHIEKALEVIRFGKQQGGKLEPVCIQRGPLAETHFIACRYFATEKWEFGSRIAATTSFEHFDLLIILEGSGSFEWESESLGYAQAQVWLLPAALSHYKISPATSTSLLRTYVPSSLEEVSRRLAAQGVSEAALSRLVYP